MPVNKENQSCYYVSPVGVLKIHATAKGISAIQFLGDMGLSQEHLPIPAHPFLDQTVEQLNEYFEGRRQEFSIPLAPKGTPFQFEVWDALMEIPYGITCSYGEVAAAIGRPRASRAVGRANNANPLPILIPCHRVIGADGSLVGYGGGLEIKKKLLALEQEYF